MRGAGDGEERRCDVSRLHSIPGHLVQVRGVHVLVVVPSKTIEGDEQQLVPDGPAPRVAQRRRGRRGNPANEAEHGEVDQQHYTAHQLKQSGAAGRSV